MRLYKLDTQTGHIINLIDELALHYPLGSHERQEHSHAHFIHETPDQRFVVVTDLGADRIITYEFSDKGFKKVQYHNLMMQMGLVISHFITMDNMRMWYMNYQISSV